jgi:hypothetical protein
MVHAPYSPFRLFGMWKNECTWDVIHTADRHIAALGVLLCMAPDETIRRNGEKDISSKQRKGQRCFLDCAPRKGKSKGRKRTRTAGEKKLSEFCRECLHMHNLKLLLWLLHNRTRRS